MAKKKFKKKVAKKTAAKVVPELNPIQQFLANRKQFAIDQATAFRKRFPR